ncbi:MAG: acyltransferase [Oleispira sp.]|nr:acyltransferase [Oleispira sp.]
MNGLRAIAVIAVVLFHFNPSWMPGGFSGVDVFFVISGFLMTGIIFKGIEQENFSILKFYVARANRVIPALAILCLVSLVFGWFYLTPLDYKALGEHVASSISFVSNVTYWKESGYFDAESHEKWLLHTWSLSAEWQFYIIYPLVLVTMRKYMSIKSMRTTILLGTISGFIFCVITTYKWPNSAYYLLSARAWEMMIGGVAYLYPVALKEERKKILEWFGLALIIGSYFFISKDTPWPGYLALLPVLGSFLIIQAQRNNSIITSNPISQKIGAWSYSIYLWHWPLVVAIYYFSLSDMFIYLGITLSVLLGFISHKYIEQMKFRNDFTSIPSYLKCKPVYMVLVIGIIGNLVFSYEGIDSPVRRGASTPQANFLNTYEKAHRNLDDAYWLKCNTYTSLNDNDTLDVDPTCIETKGTGGVFLWGDSHAEALSLGLRTLLKPLDMPFYQKTSAGCHASLIETTKHKGIFRKACNHSNKIALESISKVKPKLVIIAQANGHNSTDWNAIGSKLKAIGVEKVLLIGPVSQWKPSLPKVMIKSKNWNKEIIFVNDSGLDMSIIEEDAQMKQTPLSTDLEYVSLIDDLCRLNSGKYYCRAKLNSGELLQVDYGHLSEEGSIFVVKEILAEKMINILN